jgi:DNA-binding GntR family transcriptional regulator
MSKPMNMIATPGRIALDRTRQASPQIVEHLRERILALDLAPGTVLSRAELQKQFGLSQTPVRDALLKLEEEGLVTVYPQHATLVSRIDLDKARQAHFLRRAVEADVVRLLAERRPDGAVADLRRANAAVAAQAEAQDFSAFLQADREFHNRLFHHADMLLVWPILRANSGHLDRLRRLNLPNVGMQRVVRQHAAIVDAIEKGEAKTAEKALRSHLANTLAMLDTIAIQHPEFIEA